MIHLVRHKPTTAGDEALVPQQPTGSLEPIQNLLVSMNTLISNASTLVGTLEAPAQAIEAAGGSSSGSANGVATRGSNTTVVAQLGGFLHQLKQGMELMAPILGRISTLCDHEHTITDVMEREDAARLSRALVPVMQQLGVLLTLLSPYFNSIDLGTLPGHPHPEHPLATPSTRHIVAPGVTSVTIQLQNEPFTPGHMAHITASACAGLPAHIDPRTFNAARAQLAVIAQSRTTSGACTTISTATTVAPLPASSTHSLQAPPVGASNRRLTIPALSQALSATGHPQPLMLSLDAQELFRMVAQSLSQATQAVQGTHSAALASQLPAVPAAISRRRTSQGTVGMQPPAKARHTASFTTASEEPAAPVPPPTSWPLPPQILPRILPSPSPDVNAPPKEIPECSPASLLKLFEDVKGDTAQQLQQHAVMLADLLAHATHPKDAGHEGFLAEAIAVAAHRLSASDLLELVAGNWCSTQPLHPHLNAWLRSRIGLSACREDMTKFAAVLLTELRQWVATVDTSCTQTSFPTLSAALLNALSPAIYSLLNLFSFKPELINPDLFSSTLQEIWKNFAVAFSRSLRAMYHGSDTGFFAALVDVCKQILAPVTGPEAVGIAAGTLCKNFMYYCHLDNASQRPPTYQPVGTPTAACRLSTPT
eukprot:TRINITY_DN1710_c0_g1_i2.p1 TRINITY_DN1710_c0_g1~~TRINITY_DN1710_c0_g1_i2.p1  ORF type:complete len:652 (-),score=126.43 TRINITY_DN1710_c0_g1_i2:85-2040(-)